MGNGKVLTSDSEDGQQRTLSEALEAVPKGQIRRPHLSVCLLAMGAGAQDDGEAGDEKDDEREELEDGGKVLEPAKRGAGQAEQDAQEDEKDGYWGEGSTEG